ncbi:MAG: ComEC/Rec2 family competence protein [Pseudomonadota bacterium]
MSFSFAAGIVVYTLLPSEPSWQLLTIVLVGLTGFAFLENRRRGLTPLALLALVFWAGGTVSSIRTAYVETPRLAHEMTVDLTGRVLERIARPNGIRLVVSVDTVNDKSLDNIVFPRRIRIRVPNETSATIGDKVQMRGRLFPPAGPVTPGGYDFSFQAYFAQIGATGFSFGSPMVLEDEGPPLVLRFASLVQSVRELLAARIKADIGADREAALVVALLVGDRSAISDRDQEDLRAAGLAHILAISGLHMALFAGGAYAATLFLLSLVPALNLRQPIHKFAAATALLAAVFYLLISGGSIATQRSFLMISLVFLGVLIGRRGLTVRSVALAALFLLALAPERLFHPGFQMSFAAVICLVAVYDAWRERSARTAAPKSYQGDWTARFMRSAGKWFLGLVVTALVAGIATGIIAAHHFGRVAPLGLAGNLLGMPVFSLVVMPMGVLAFVLMPFGLAALPLSVMAFGLRILLEIAAFVADLDGGSGVIERITAGEMLAFLTALFAFLLLRGPLRLCALLPVAVGLGLVQMSFSPDVQIAASGQRVAVRDQSGLLRWSGRRETFQIETWYQAEGIATHKIKSRKIGSPQIRCDRLGCVVEAHARVRDPQDFKELLRPLRIALPKTQEALNQDCRYADLIVSDLIVPETCSGSIVFDGKLRHDRGAISLWLSAKEPDVRTPRSASNSTDRDGATLSNVGIAKIEFAIENVPRPWHRHGTVTRASLK